jgi:hypothetical protein
VAFAEVHHDSDKHAAKKTAGILRRATKQKFPKISLVPKLRDCFVFSSMEKMKRELVYNLFSVKRDS